MYQSFIALASDKENENHISLFVVHNHIQPVEVSF